MAVPGGRRLAGVPSPPKEHTTMSFMMQAGTIKFGSQGGPVTNPNDTNKFTNVRFEVEFPKNSEVIVIPAVQTFNGADTPGLRITDVNHRGFKARMNELVARVKPESDGSHTEETIGYLAIASFK